MALIVQKFGGTSVADAERIKTAARRAIAARKKGHSVVMVVSARGKTTDKLYDLAYEIPETPPAREIDMLLSTGEQESVALMAMAIISMGQPAISFTGAQIGLVTDRYHMFRAALLFRFFGVVFSPRPAGNPKIFEKPHVAFLLCLKELFALIHNLFKIAAIRFCGRL